MPNPLSRIATALNPFSKSAGKSSGESFASWSGPWAEAIELLCLPTRISTRSPLTLPQYEAISGFLTAYAQKRATTPDDKKLAAFDERLPLAQHNLFASLGPAWNGPSLPLARAASQAVARLCALPNAFPNADHLILGLRVAINDMEGTAWPGEALAELRSIAAPIERLMDQGALSPTMKNHMDTASTIVQACQVHASARPDGSAQEKTAADYRLESRLLLPISKEPIDPDTMTWVDMQWEEVVYFSRKDPEWKSHIGTEAPPNLPFWRHQIARRVHAKLGADATFYGQKIMGSRPRLSTADTLGNNAMDLAHIAAQRRSQLGQASSAIAEQAAKRGDAAPAKPMRRS